MAHFDYVYFHSSDCSRGKKITTDELITMAKNEDPFLKTIRNNLYQTEFSREEKYKLIFVNRKDNAHFRYKYPNVKSSMAAGGSEMTEEHKKAEEWLWKFACTKKMLPLLVNDEIFKIKIYSCYKEQEIKIFDTQYRPDLRFKLDFLDANAKRFISKFGCKKDFSFDFEIFNTSPCNTEKIISYEGANKLLIQWDIRDLNIFNSYEDFSQYVSNGIKVEIIVQYQNIIFHEENIERPSYFCRYCNYLYYVKQSNKNENEYYVHEFDITTKKYTNIYSFLNNRLSDVQLIKAAIYRQIKLHNSTKDNNL